MTTNSPQLPPAAQAATPNGQGPTFEPPPESVSVVVSQRDALESYKRGLEPVGLVQAMEVATVLARTGYCGVSTPEEAFAKIMFGRELGLTVMNSLRAIYVVNGRPGIDATVMHALCLQSAACEYFEPIATTKEVARYRVKRRGREQFELEWTIQQAKDAGMFGGKPDPKNPSEKTKPKDNWVNYPENMLRARCIANLARMWFPECINGMHTRDELESMNEAELSRIPVAVASSQVAPAQSAIDATRASYAMARDGLLAKIASATTPDDKKRVREEIKTAKDNGSLPAPWIDEVAAAYNKKYTKAKDAPPAAAAGAAPTVAAAPAPATTAASTNVAPPAPASGGDDVDRGDNPDDH